jgi:hypothetical protein
MATFLELCQMVARESGTISGTLPTTVSAQTGRLNKIVNWTNLAWLDIQNTRSSWLWMRQEFMGAAIANTSRYTPASWDIDDLSSWITDAGTVTLYDTSIGVSDEGELPFTPWPEWRVIYGRGTQTPNRPVTYTITPANEFALGPLPDTTYTVRGEYVQVPQSLSANTDTPNCPLRFHNIVAYRALMMLAGHDEAPTTYAEAQSNFSRFMSDLERDQLPAWGSGSGPLA